MNGLLQWPGGALNPPNARSPSSGLQPFALRARPSPITKWRQWRRRHNLGFLEKKPGSVAGHASKRQSGGGETDVERTPECRSYGHLELDVLEGHHETKR